MSKRVVVVVAGLMLVAIAAVFYLFGGNPLRGGILIDGKRLTSLMIRYGVGVQVRETYRVVEIDEDFFA